MEVSEEELRNMTPEQIAELQKQNCIFCQIGEGKVPSKKIYEDEDFFAVLDINPATAGHVLLLSKEHYAVMPQMPDPAVGQMFLVAKQLSQMLLKGVPAKGTTIFVANGIVAGQKAPHVMVHIIPRKSGDGVTIEVPKGELGVDQTEQVKQQLQPVLRKILGLSEVVEEPKPEIEKPQKPKPVNEKPPEPPPVEALAKEAIPETKPETPVEPDVVPADDSLESLPTPPDLPKLEDEQPDSIEPPTLPEPTKIKPAETPPEEPKPAETPPEQPKPKPAKKPNLDDLL